LIPKVTQAHIALIIVALAYGGNYIIAKDVMNGAYMKPLGFVLLRVLCGGILFWIFHHIFVKEKLRKADLPLVMLCGLFGVAVNQSFFFSGLEKTTPIHASLIMTTTPIMVLVISNLIIRENITLRKIAGIITGISGAVLLILMGDEAIHLSSDFLLGDIMILVNATSYGLYLVLVKKLTVKYHPLTVIKWVFTFGFLYLLPFGSGQLYRTEWVTFDGRTWLSVMYVILFVTFLAYLLNVFAVKIVNPSIASIYIYLQPLLASILSLMLGREEISPPKVIAAICIFIGVYLVSTRKSLFKL
jgi:drug/metabolite transporter (DMT)-like permease